MDKEMDRGLALPYGWGMAIAKGGSVRWPPSGFAKSRFMNSVKELESLARRSEFDPESPRVKNLSLAARELGKAYVSHFHRDMDRAEAGGGGDYSVADPWPAEAP
jgi:hypothetical protein